MKISLGSGNERFEDFTNIDSLPLKNVDIVADLTKGIPLPDDSVEEVRAFNVLEHLSDTVFIMEEIYRVCKNGARVRIKVPYFKSTAAFKDPTHVKFFTEDTFAYFDRDFIDSERLPEYNLKSNFKLVKIDWNYYLRGVQHLPFISVWRNHFWNVAKTIIVELRVEK